MASEVIQRRLTIPAAFLATAILFALDSSLMPGIAVAVLYVLPVWLAYASGKVGWIWIFAVLTSVLTILDLLLATSSVDWNIAYINRTSSLLAIWITAALCRQISGLVAVHAERAELVQRNLTEMERHHAEQQKRAIAMASVLEDLRMERKRLTFEVEERRRAEEALKRSERHARSIIDAALDGVVAIDQSGGIVEWNPQAEKIFGRTYDETVGRQLAELIIPEQYREAHHAGIARFLATGAGPVLNQRLELTALRRTGETFPIELAICSLPGPSGWMFSAFVRDITERKRAEQRFRATVESAPTAMIMIDAGGRMVLTNAAAERLFGYPAAELLGESIDRLFPERFRELHPLRNANGDAARATEEDREWFGLRKDGTEFPLDIGLSPVATDDGAFILSAIVDITERKRFEHAQRDLQQELERRVAERTTELRSEVERRKQVEIELRGSQTRLSLAMQAAVVGTWNWKIGEDRIQWDDYLHPLFGLMPGEFPGRFDAFVELLHPDDRVRVQEEVDRSLTDDADYDTEFRVIWPDRSEHHIGARGKVYRDEEGKPTHMTGVCWDLTQRRHAEEQLRRTAATLDRIAVELALPPRDFQAADAVFHAGSFSLTDMMTCGSAIRGMSPTGRDADDISRRVVRYLYERFRDEENDRAFALVRMFETKRYAELSDDLRSLAGQTAGVTDDTTCLVLAATAGDDEAWNEVQASKDHRVIPLVSRELVEQMPMVSQLLRQLGFDTFDVAPPEDDDSWFAPIKGVFHVGEAAGSRWIPNQEFVAAHRIRSVVGFGDRLPNGRLYTVIAFSKIPIPLETAKLLSHLSLSLKMALQPLLKHPRRTEAQIVALDQLLRNHEAVVAEQEAALRKQTEALAKSNFELEQFAYVASHDLQEPLRAISGYCQLIERRYQEHLEPQARDWLGNVIEGALRMKTLITDLLEYSRAGRKGAPFRLTDLNDVLKQTLFQLQVSIAESEAEVQCEGLPTLRVDVMQLTRLFQNLIGNAIKYRGENKPLIRIAAQERRHDWLLSISDNGIGIEQQYYDRIFVIFQRLHTRNEYPGTGIGLAVCKKIVERHGGKIWVQSNPGQGSTFCFTIAKRLDDDSGK